MPKRTLDRQPLRIATLNVWGRFADWSTRLERLVACFPQREPDILLLQEVVDDGATDQAAEIAEALGYEHLERALTRLESDVEEGVAIAARPLLSGARSEELPASRPARRTVVAEVELGAAPPLTIASAHTIAAPPAVRAGQVEAIVRRPEDRLVIGADLNLPPGGLARLLDGCGLRDSLDLSAEPPTWPVCRDTFSAAWEAALGHAPKFSLSPKRIDYLLSRGVEVVASGVEPLGSESAGYASDHALVWADYRF